MNHQKHIYFCALIVMLMILCTACSQADKPKKIDYNTILELQADINITAPTDEPKITGENETGDSVEVKNDELYWDWPVEMNFTGVKSEMKDFRLGNLSTNIDARKSTSCMICPDKENDILYYINVVDHFIYKQEGDKKTLLVEMKANNLQLWDNKLYFINIKPEEDFTLEDFYYYYHTGPIYSFDLETEELKLILDKKVALFYIDNFGIYYRELETYPNFKVNLLDFNNNITSLDNYPWVLSYNEYLLTLLDGYLSLVNRYTDEITQIMPYDELIAASSIHIFGDILAFTVGPYVCTLDLRTGDKHIYDGAKVETFFADLKSNGLIPRLEDLAFVNNNIYASYGSKLLLKVDLSKNEISRLLMLNNLQLIYYYLQTDGDKIYTIAYESNWITHKTIFNGCDIVYLPTEGNVLTREEFVVVN